MAKWRTLTIGILALVGSASSALAQSGQHEALVRQALDAATRGECPATVLAPMLRGICLQQQPRMGQHLTALGSITQMEFLGVQAIPNAPSVEVYRVIFSGGGSMVWSASSGPDGKLVALFSSG